MSHFKSADLKSEERFVYTYSSISQAELEQKIDAAMLSRGYKHRGSGIYEKGNRVVRLLLGAMHKYFKFQVSLDASNPQEIKVGLKKMTSGFSGGIIGMNQVKNELRDLSVIFENI